MDVDGEKEITFFIFYISILNFPRCKGHIIITPYLHILSQLCSVADAVSEKTSEVSSHKAHYGNQVWMISE